MVSRSPLPDRCAARVVSKIGLEIDTQYANEPLTDDVVAMIRLRDSSRNHVVEGAPEYNEIREYLWNDYEVEAVTVCPDTELVDVDLADPPVVDDDRMAAGKQLDSDTTYEQVAWSAIDDEVTDQLDPDEDDVASDLEWIHLDYDPVANVTNRRSRLDGYCERYPMDNGRCYVHGGDNTGAPEGNTNAMTHGLRAQRSNYYQALEQDEKEFVEAMVDGWLKDAPFERDHAPKVNELYRVAIDQHRAWLGVDEYVDEDGEFEGLTKEEVIRNDDGDVVYDDDGDPMTSEIENALNLPYSRLDGDVMGKLKKLGVLDDPDSKQAEADESLAQKLSGGS